MAKIPAVTGTFDVIYEAVGVPAVAFAATEALSPNGLLILTGIPPPADPIALPLAQIMKSIVLTNQAIVGTVNASRSAFALSIQRLEQAMYLMPQSVRGIISRRVPLDAAAETLREPHGVKDVIQVGLA